MVAQTRHSEKKNLSLEQKNERKRQFVLNRLSTNKGEVLDKYKYDLPKQNISACYFFELRIDLVSCANLVNIWLDLFRPQAAVIVIYPINYHQTHYLITATIREKSIMKTTSRVRN